MKISPALKWALRASVAGMGTSLACSGSLGGLGGDDAGLGGNSSTALASSGGGSTGNNSAASSGSTAAATSSTASSSSAGNAANGSATNANNGSSSSGSSTASTTVQSAASSSGSPTSAASSSGLDAGADAAPLSFATDIYTPIISDRCIACHTRNNGGGDGFTEGRLDLTTGGAAGAYAQLVNVNAMGDVPGSSGVTCAASDLVRVVPGSAVTSLLYLKVNSKIENMPAPCGNPMPQPDAGAPLTSAQIATIFDWINQGAKP